MFYTKIYCTTLIKTGVYKHECSNNYSFSYTCTFSSNHSIFSVETLFWVYLVCPSTLFACCLFGWLEFSPCNKIIVEHFLDFYITYIIFCFLCILLIYLPVTSPYCCWGSMICRVHLSKRLFEFFHKLHVDPNDETQQCRIFYLEGYQLHQWLLFKYLFKISLKFMKYRARQDKQIMCSILKQISQCNHHEPQTYSLQSTQVQ